MLLPAAEESIRLRVAVPPATAEVDERARDGVWPSDTDAESIRAEANRTNWFNRRARDFMKWVHSKHVLIGLSVLELPILNTQYG